MTPLAVLWAANDEILRWYQPYVTLARGHAAAEESLLLDYVCAMALSSVLKCVVDNAVFQQIVLR